MPRTRLAPSPTGALHLGNARTFLVNWAMARQQGWEIVLRIEDLDGPRIKPGAAEGVAQTLAWLGLDWDEGPFTQAAEPAPYAAALRRLARQGDAYPCRCTRAEIAAASLSAPQEGVHELRYPGTCRPPSPGVGHEDFRADPNTAWRLVVPPGPRAIVDRFVGSTMADTQATVGDFLVATKGGQPSYQLAVVVDDARQGVDRVVRGADLLDSTPRQALLYERLGLGPPPETWHLPLVRGEDGRRLAKRHGDTRLDAYRERGVSAERVVGLLAEWSGAGPRREMTPREFLAAFDLDHLPPADVRFVAADDAWLLRR